MNQQDSFLAYIASKCFVLLTKSDKNLNQIAKKKICELIAKYSLERENRILKEGVRFFLNIIIHKQPKLQIVDYICWLINEALLSTD